MRWRRLFRPFAVRPPFAFALRHCLGQVGTLFFFCLLQGNEQAMRIAEQSLQSNPCKMVVCKWSYANNRVQLVGSGVHVDVDALSLRTGIFRQH